MKRFLLLASLAGSLSAQALLRQSGFCGCDGDWTPWSQREDTLPKTFVDTKVSIGDAGSLAVNGASKVAAYGGWQRQVAGIKSGEWIRFSASYRAENVAAENWQVVARLDWRNAKDKRAGEPDYVPWARRNGDWNELSLEAQAPEGTDAVTIELLLANAPQGTVWWDSISLEKIPAPKPRKVTVASINFRPERSSGREENVARFVETIGKAVPQTVDVILLPEGISIVGTGKAYVDVAETVPGPTTEALGKVAKARQAYVAAGIYEKEGGAIYNTSVLIDRKGELVGKYRKVYLPREEVEAGLTPGSHFPVFQTDFGRVGMMICYDVFFADPARFLANQGADIVLMPIWGGDEDLAKARAIENGVFLVASGYSHPTYVMDPFGERLSQAKDQATAAVATIDLERRYRAKWLGDMRTRRIKELRTDVKQPTPGFVQ